MLQVAQLDRLREGQSSHRSTTLDAISTRDLRFPVTGWRSARAATTRYQISADSASVESYGTARCRPSGARSRSNSPHIGLDRPSAPVPTDGADGL